ncbi:Lactate utilization protein B [Candidatus Calditenuaceae archaeon HR02]|nr:Lactate utilization protein B [Candidatus Calditenuaceae archaeon HR02]
MSRSRIVDALEKKWEIDTRWRSMLTMHLKSREGIARLQNRYLEGIFESRRRAVENLERLVALTVESVKREGGNVYVAKTAEDARRYVVSLAESRGVKCVIKSKSMTTEEIDLNNALLSRGIDVIETDLGERIVQLAGQRPSHIIAPAVHLSREEIARLVNEKKGADLPHQPEAITRFFRQDLWSDFKRAEMGITGANVVVAETGQVVLVTNEGNGRLVTAMPRILVSIAGIEKIVETWDDAFNVLRVLPVSAVGRDTTSYITVIGPRGMSRHVKTPEYHMVLLDNGRMEASQDPWLKDALRCIRCAACLDICPTYRILGGHVFGDIYSGPMGVPWTAITKSLKDASGIAKYCVSCSLCLHVCPVQIDIPITISWIKHASAGKTLRERMLTMYEFYAVLGSRLPRLFNWLQGSRVSRRLMEGLLGIDRRRLMHRFRGGNLYEVLGEEYLRRRDADIVYFPDTFAAYIDWGIGLLVVRVLEALGYTVAVPRTYGSGMPSIQYGFLLKAKRVAEKNVEKLKSYAEAGVRIVCSEPTAAYCLREAYPKILNTPSSQRVSESTWELTNLIATEAKSLSPNTEQSPNTYVFYHHPCHSRLLSPGRPSEDLLKRIGLNVATVDYGCCGIAGTWGMRRGVEGFLISAEIGRRVAEIILGTGCMEIATESSVCAQQLGQFTGLKVRHTIRYIAHSLGIQHRDEGVLNF